MNESLYAKGITAEDLRIFLVFWPKLFTEVEKERQGMVEDGDKVFSDDALPFSWCYLYELPIKEHLVHVLTSIIKNFEGMLDQEQVLKWFNELATARSQIGELPGIIAKIGGHYDEMEDISKEHAEKLRPMLADTFGKCYSMINTLHCVLYHGCFLNELIERVRAGDDKALFDAIRIDSTVICCLSVSSRISKAALLKDNSFFIKLKAAINGKLAKREQANFQKMRLVLEVLHEAGAIRLSNDQLHELFIEELKLYSGNAKQGGNAKALRKFADTYMKKSTTT